MLPTSYFFKFQKKLFTRKQPISNKKTSRCSANFVKAFTVFKILLKFNNTASLMRRALEERGTRSCPTSLKDNYANCKNKPVIVSQVLPKNPIFLHQKCLNFYYLTLALLFLFQTLTHLCSFYC